MNKFFHVTDSPGTQYTSLEDRFNSPNIGRVAGLGVAGMLAGGTLGWLATRNMSRGARALGVLGGSTVLGGLASIGSLAYDMTHAGKAYDMDTYKAPIQAGQHVVIGMSGAGDGRGSAMDKYMESRYGKGNYAMFRWNDRERLKNYLSKLPRGTKVTAHGHSYGASSLMNVLKDWGGDVDTVYTADPVSWTERLDYKPDNIKNWYNIVPEQGDYTNDYNWVAALGGRWGNRSGATNIKAKPGVGHGSYSKLIGSI